MIHPLFSNILIKPMEATNKTANGILLPSESLEKPQIGEVMAVGFGDLNDEGKSIPPVVKVGNKVLYKKWGGNEVKVKDEEWLIIEEKDILAVLDDE